MFAVVACVSPERLTYSCHIAVSLGQGRGKALRVGAVMRKTKSFVILASHSSKKSMEVKRIPYSVACEGVRLHAGCQAEIVYSGHDITGSAIKVREEGE